MKENAVVFFARDFLSKEFPKIGKRLDGLKRVYITTSNRDSNSIYEIDPAALVVNLNQKDLNAKKGMESFAAIDSRANLDRFLRFYKNDFVNDIREDVGNCINKITSKYNVMVYMDEPVSTYVNDSFNSKFTENGAVCLHFQTSWLPGIMFFTSDKAQLEPVEVNSISDGITLIEGHIKSRLKGMATPLYVINYGSVLKRLNDAMLTTLKAVYRKLKRKNAFYIDKDIASHLFHAKALLSSLKGGYINEFSTTNKKYVVFPLHYEPEAVLTYFSEHTRQVEIAEKILDSLPCDYELIVKEHPSQPGVLNMKHWHSLTKSKRVLKVLGVFPTNDLFKLDSIVVSQGSTMVLEAVLAGIPAGVLGGVHFHLAPGVIKLNSPGDWIKLIGNKPMEHAEIISWYGEFLNKYCFDGSFMKGASRIDGVVRIIKKLVRQKDESPST